MVKVHALLLLIVKETMWTVIQMANVSAMLTSRNLTQDAQGVTLSVENVS